MNNSWVASVERQRYIVPGKGVRANGKSDMMPITHTYVCLARVRGDKMDTIKFTVTRRGAKITFGDHRATATGSAGTTGVFGTVDGKSSGRVETMTPTAWKAEVSRLIGPERADEIIAELR